jgi:uncharacterized protein
MTRTSPPRPWAFVDSSAHYALADSRDAHHTDAVAIANRLQTERWRLFTTNFVVAETHALVLARANRRVAAQVLEDLDHSSTTIVRVTAADEQRAREIIHRYQDKTFSLTDAISFVVMERLEIPYAFAFDDDFAQYGQAIVLTP